MPPAIPDRWIPYKALGKIIEGTRIICFKVPLRKNVQIGNKEIWTIQQLLLQVPNLGAVINLTNTTRYYDPKEFTSAGVLYKHVTMPGRVLPPENVVKLFMDTVDEFLGNGCDFILGVHCTHGLNRTGYMVCRYMRDRLNIPAEVAIKRFQKARGYKIERENYIADILGKQPPPPDIGKKTKLKPIREDKHNGEIPKKNKEIENWREEARCSNDSELTQSRYFHNSSISSWGKKDREKVTRESRKKRRRSSSSFDYSYDY